MSGNVKKGLNKYLPHLMSAKEQNLNEADTVVRIIKVFEDVFGYDVLTEITKEHQIKDKFVDIAIKLNNTIKLLIEVKAAGIELSDKHIEQAKNYAANGNFRWVLLTNGIQWRLFHLTFEEGIEEERVFTVDLSKDNIDDAVKLLSLLARESVNKDGLDEYWTRFTALSPESLGKALFSEETLCEMRRVIRKKEKFIVDIEELASALHNMLSTESRERIGPMHIYRKKKTKQSQPPIEGSQTVQDSNQKSQESIECKESKEPQPEEVEQSSTQENIPITK